MRDTAITIVLSKESRTLKLAKEIAKKETKFIHLAICFLQLKNSTTPVTCSSQDVRADLSQNRDR